MRGSFFRRPILRTVLGVLLWAAAYALARLALAERPPAWSTVGHVVLALGVLFAMLTLTAQFVLPVRTGRERLLAARQLLLYLMGVRGPVVSIENGKPLEGRGERMRRGKGVLLIDQASAAVLRTKTHFTRAVGPGVVFTEAGETLAEALDLRCQVRSASSVPPEPDAPLPADEMRTQALTQDGIPLSADLSVTFVLDPGHPRLPREGRHAHLPPYEFNPASAERAVFGHAYEDQQELPWTELPLRLAADQWREQVKQWPLSALLRVEKDKPAPLHRIEAAILERLSGNGEKESAGPLSNEAQVLQARGIRVLEVSLSNLYLPADVQETHRQNWCEAWAGGAQSALLQARKEGERAYQLGVREAQAQFAPALTASLRERLSRGETPGIQETLMLLLDDAAQTCLDSEAIPEAGALAGQLRAIAERLQEADGEHGMPSAGASP
jgi:hypothetical protein